MKLTKSLGFWVLVLLVVGGVTCAAFLNWGRAELVEKLVLPDVKGVYEGIPTAGQITGWFEGIECQPPDGVLLNPNDADALLLVSGTVAGLMSMHLPEDSGIERNSRYWKLMEANWGELTAKYDQRFGGEEKIRLVNWSIVVGTSVEWAKSAERVGWKE
jgi:hypothetical protein